MKFPFKQTILALAVWQMVPAHADTGVMDNGRELQGVTVTGTRADKQNLGEERIRRKELDEKMVQDEHDLVRYDPGISVVEGGRSGSNGFTVRGVDKDRVAINVDGLAQAESRSSEAFQELFGAYGNYNANRNAAEIENFSDVTINKGADSLKSGSGALGGAVNYRTKKAADYLQEKDWSIQLKGGYVGRNSQKFGSATFAGRLGNVDALLVYTKRSGGEVKNNADKSSSGFLDVGYRPYDPGNPISTYVEPRSYGVFRSEPDPQSWSQSSLLFKPGWYITPDNYISATYEDYRQDRDTEELSNMWASDWRGQQSHESRLRHDISYRKRIGLSYENQLEKGPWDKLTVRWDKQNITMSTWTWDLPVDYRQKGINAEVYHTFRNIYQELNQAGIDADKSFQAAKTGIILQYGIGYAKGENRNDDKTYWVKLHDANVLTSSNHTRAMLMQSGYKRKHAYLNSIFNFNDRLRVNVGIRHDRTQTQSLDGDYTGVQRKLAPFLGEGRVYKGNSYSFGLDWRVTDHLNLMAKYSSGFRAPTSDENWLMFPHPDFYLLANPDLKAERAKNIEFGIAGSGASGQFKLSVFETKYRDFIDLIYLGHSKGTNYNCPSQTVLCTPFIETSGSTGNLSYHPGIPTWQNRNRSSAWVKGIEFNGRWNLDGIGLPKGLFTGLNTSYIKGKAMHKSGKEYPMNALAPWSAIWSLGYEAPSKKWGATVFANYTARKKEQDTIRSNDDPDMVFPFARHSKSYLTWDVGGFVRIGKYFTLRGSVLNVTDRKYYTWESLRSIREFGTVNRVHRQTHTGVERFTAPGRTFNVTVEAKF